MGEKQGNSETRQCWVVRLAEKKCCKTICLAAAAVVLLVMYVLAARDAGTSEFAVKLTHELAWPLAAVALLAFVYAGELRRLIGGLKRFKLPGGIEAEVLGEEAQAQLDRKIQESGRNPERQNIYKICREMSPKARRLLANLLAAGVSRGLPLTMYPARWNKAKSELLAKDLATREDGVNYRPTLRGHKVLSAYLEVIEPVLAAQKGTDRN